MFTINKAAISKQKTRVQQKKHCRSINDTILYDTIRCGIFTCAQKLTLYGQLNLAHGTETKNKEKLKNTQKQSSSEETVLAIVYEGSPDRRSETAGRKICETGRF